MRQEDELCDVAIIGGGPVGLFMAILLGRFGLRVRVIERQGMQNWAHTPPDGREIALTHGSVSLLSDIGLDAEIDKATPSPIKKAQIETKGAAEPLYFSPDDSSSKVMEELGWLVPNYQIRNGLFAIAKRTPHVTLCGGYTLGGLGKEAKGRRDVITDQATIKASLVIAADGRFSKARTMAGIGELIHDFRRYVLVCPMAHEKDHENIALQWFDEGQAIALLPLRGKVSSLVLILPPDKVLALMKMDEAHFNAEISSRTQGRVGQMQLTGKRQFYPLKTVFAHRFTASHFALIGDAAVGMNPITAHGFNLGLKGAAHLHKYVMENILYEADPGARRGLRGFELQHRWDTALLFAGTNFIATLYGRDDALAYKLRQALLKAANLTPIFRRKVTDLLMNEGA